jgi:LacI family transcriptional regulator
LLVADNEYQSQIELQNLRSFYGHRISGLIIRTAYAPSNYDYLRRLQQRGTAIVEIDYIQPGSPFSHVMLANEEAGFEGVRYLYELGHRRIAYVGKPATADQPEERYTGFVRGLEHFQLALPDAYQAALVSYNEADAYSVTRRLLALAELPTAIFAFNGTCTLSAFRAIREQKLRIPEDISLLGFDNYPWTGLVEPPLDVFEQPVEEMALAAVEVLMQQIMGEGQTVIRKRLSGRLIKRGSCAPPQLRR